MEENTIYLLVAGAVVLVGLGLWAYYRHTHGSISNLITGIKPVTNIKVRVGHAVQGGGDATQIPFTVSFTDPNPTSPQTMYVVYWKNASGTQTQTNSGQAMSYDFSWSVDPSSPLPQRITVTVQNSNPDYAVGPMGTNQATYTFTLQ
jgi:hypothetical protein